MSLLKIPSLFVPSDGQRACPCPLCPPATLKSNARSCPCHNFLIRAIARIARCQRVLARAARGQKRAFWCIVNRCIFPNYDLKNQSILIPCQCYQIQNSNYLVLCRQSVILCVIHFEFEITEICISVTIVGTRPLLSGIILLYLIDKHAKF